MPMTSHQLALKLLKMPNKRIMYRDFDLSAPDQYEDVDEVYDIEEAVFWVDNHEVIEGIILLE